MMNSRMSSVIHCVEGRLGCSFAAFVSHAIVCFCYDIFNDWVRFVLSVSSFAIQALIWNVVTQQLPLVWEAALNEVVGCAQRVEFEEEKQVQSRIFCYEIILQTYMFWLSIYTRYVYSDLCHMWAVHSYKWWRDHVLVLSMPSKSFGTVVGQIC